MSANLARAVNTHRFPPVFVRHPRLLAVVHLVMRLTTLRVWYVRRAFRQVLPSLPPSFRWVDAGCGHGDYILPAARRYRGAYFIGIDRIADNVEVSEGYARARGLDNVTFVQDDVMTYAYEPPADGISCIGVMQLVDDDAALLRRFYGGLKPGGVLLLYESILNRRILPFFETTLRRYFKPYDVVQNQRHVYTPEEVLDRLRAAGFSVASVRYSFGFAGRLYHELYTLAMYVVLSAHPVWYVLLVPLFALAMPFFWLLMAVDYAGRRSSGNGMVIVARRS